MTDQTEIEAVTRRLSQALDLLDAAVERRLEIDIAEDCGALNASELAVTRRRHDRME